MTWRTTFASLTGASQNLSLYDAMFNDIAGMLAIPCAAAGQNAIILTPLTNAPTLPAYGFLNLFSFDAPATSSGLVTAQFSLLPALPVFNLNGTTQIAGGQIVAGQPYMLRFSPILNVGGGGFFLLQFGPATPTIPSGAIMAFNLSAAPSGWLLCDGTQGTPDLRGYFIRGFDSTGLIDPGRVLGSVQQDQFQDHLHNYSAPQGANAFAGGAGFAENSVVIAPTTLPISGSHGAETRPKNVALIYCQKI